MQLFFSMQTFPMHCFEHQCIVRNYQHIPMSHIHTYFLTSMQMSTLLAVRKPVSSGDESVPVATQDQKRAGKDLITRLVGVMLMKTSYNDLRQDDPEKRYVAMASAFLRVFLEDAVKASEYTVMMCSLTTGGAVELDLNNLLHEEVVGSSEEEEKVLMRQMLQLGISMGSWNFPIFSLPKKESIPTSLTSVVVMAFKKSDWACVENNSWGVCQPSSSEPFSSLPTKVVSKLYSAGFCKRYDFLYPVNLLEMKMCIFDDLRISKDGRCGNVNCTVIKSNKTCSGCNVFKYCSRACQKEDWGGHKKMCNSIQNQGLGEMRLLRLDNADLEEAKNNGWIVGAQVWDC